MKQRMERGGTLLSHRTPDISSSSCFIHTVSSCLLYSVLMSPLLCTVLPGYLNSVTCGSWEDCILTLPNGVPFRHMHYVFAVVLTLSFLSYPRLPFTAPVSTPARRSFSLAHSTKSSANIILPRCFFSDVFRQ